MKKISSVILSLFVVFFACSSANALTGYQIQLGGGTAAPGQKLSVSASKLIPDVNYTIQCKVNASVATMMHFTIGGVFAYNNYPAVINSKNIGSISVFGQNGALNAGDNDFLMPQYKITINRSGAILDFLNLDDSAVVTVSNCIATPV